jgi:hypothetical protein
MPILKGKNCCDAAPAASWSSQFSDQERRDDDMKNESIEGIGNNKRIYVKERNKLKLNYMKQVMEDNDDRFKELWLYRKI